MITINLIDIFGFRGAIKGMRNPKNSWDRSDSTFDGEKFNLGKNDLELCKKLIKGGTEHRKFLRMIHVQLDITAPLYWWKEMDTYKVGTVSNSCSTMHKLLSKPFSLDDFSHDQMVAETGLEQTIEFLSNLRNGYLLHEDEFGKKKLWYTIIQLLPSSYNQLRTLDMNYETLLTIYHQRKNHKLYEWQDFCTWIEDLPYMKEFLKEQK